MANVGFVMLPSYYEAIRPLDDVTRLAMFDAITDYAFTGALPADTNPVVSAMFSLVRPNIDASIARYSANVRNGAKGGRPPKDKSKQKPNQNPSETQAEPTENQDKEKERERERDTENTGESDFLLFWSAYPKKAKMPAAREAWENIGPDSGTLSQMMAALAVQRKSEQWLEADGRFIPDPANWLYQRRWEDSTEIARTSNEPASHGTVISSKNPHDGERLEWFEDEYGERKCRWVPIDN